MEPASSADVLQLGWQLPFELLDLAPQRGTVQLAAVTAEGAVYAPAADPSPAESEADSATFDADLHGAAYAVAARLPDGSTKVAASDAASASLAASWLAARPGPAAWLLKVEAGAVEVLRGPEPVVPRAARGGPVALLVDLGMVLVGFDRGALARHFRLAFGRPAPLAGIARVEAMRADLEAGRLLADDFLDAAREPLQLARAEQAAFARVWGSILAARPDSVALVRSAAALPEVAVAVVSNTDPIRLRWCREELALGDLLEWVAASCQDGVNPKGVDASMWERGRELAAAQLGVRPAVVIGVDDVRGHLARAVAAGVVTRPVHYRHFAQFRYALGAAGLYLPQAR
ncbi:MAG TPA: hypothetical protein VGC54_12275 [Planctomycetota bacterium]